MNTITREVIHVKIGINKAKRGDTPTSLMRLAVAETIRTTAMVYEIFENTLAFIPLLISMPQTRASVTRQIPWNTPTNIADHQNAVLVIGRSSRWIFLKRSLTDQTILAQITPPPPSDWRHSGSSPAPTGGRGIEGSGRGRQVRSRSARYRQGCAPSVPIRLLKRR